LADRGDGRARLFDAGATLMLALPPTALAAGWFLAINPVADPSRLAPVAVIAINAVMALPFALRVLKPAHDRARDDHDRLCAALGIRGVNRLRIVDWPALRRPLASAFAFAMALSLGDLGVIALFGAENARTLPYLVLQRMGAYRTLDAAGLALLIALLCLVLMALSDRLATEKPA
ncbi:MAG: ABC transporter permease subunit, partial [Rhizobiaceae bacterium]